MSQFDKSLVWFRRDLRCFDHAALYHALTQSRRVFCVFVFDRQILDELPSDDRRIGFLHASIVELEVSLRQLGGGLIVRHARAAQEIPRLAQELEADAVFFNHDYEPLAIERDNEVGAQLTAAGRWFASFKDQVIFEKDEVLSQAGKPFSVFTPYKNAWLKKLQTGNDGDACLRSYRIEAVCSRLARPPSDLPCAIPSIAELGFDAAGMPALAIPSGMAGGQSLLDDFACRIARYDAERDFPAKRASSYLSMHLRFGTVSIRDLAHRAFDASRNGEGGTGASAWLSELIWRDFYFMILHYHPHVAVRAFKPQYDAIKWESGAAAEAHFQAWCEGRTGYPLVDAAMLQLNRSGYMHNRLRMVTANFLIKDLGIDWRRGERYFAARLNDFDLAANNGGWQWAASSGCDAQPYFRIFNPLTQSEKFDPEGVFIRTYLPQLAKLSARQIHAPWRLPADQLQAAGITLGIDYPVPVVEHEAARKRTLARYAVVKETAPPASKSG